MMIFVENIFVIEPSNSPVYTRKKYDLTISFVTL
jgi:hypothetical protein